MISPGSFLPCFQLLQEGQFPVFQNRTLTKSLLPVIPRAGKYILQYGLFRCSIEKILALQLFRWLQPVLFSLLSILSCVCHPFRSQLCSLCQDLILFALLSSSRAPFNTEIVFSLSKSLIFFAGELAPQKSLDSTFSACFHLQTRFGWQPAASWKWPTLCFLVKLWSQH